MRVINTVYLEGWSKKVGVDVYNLDDNEGFSFKEYANARGGKVVPLEDVEPLVEALRQIGNNTGSGDFFGRLARRTIATWDGNTDYEES